MMDTTDTVDLDLVLSGKMDLELDDGVRPMINARGTLTIIGGSMELPEVRAAKARGQPAVRQPRGADGSGRQAAGRTDRRRVGHGQLGLRRGDVACDGRLRGRWQSRTCTCASRTCAASPSPKSSSRPLAQRLRCGHPRRRRHHRRSRHARGTGTRDRSEDGDDLRLRRTRATRPARCRSRRSRDRQAARRADHGGCRRRDPHRPQHPPAARRDAGRLQRRQDPPRTAERRVLLGRKDLVQAAWMHSAPHHGYAGR